MFRNTPTQNSLLPTQGYGSTLVELVLRSDHDGACRQMASVLLNQLVEGHWSVPKDKHCEFQVDAAVGAWLFVSLLVSLCRIYLFIACLFLTGEGIHQGFFGGWSERSP